MKRFLLFAFLTLTMLWSNTYAQSTIFVAGRYILGPCGDTLLLRGVNYAPYNWGYSPSSLLIDQIALTGANCVRLPWYKNHPNPTAHAVYSDVAKLDSVLSKCIQHDLIPILELHDLTCAHNPEGLISLAEWFEQPAIKALIDKYKHSIIVNIANEALHISWTGSEATGKTTFINTYTTIVNNLRSSGISVPLMIDASECGNNIDVLSDMAATLQGNDPQHNLIFSVHAYWWGYSNMDSTRARNMIENAISKNFPLVFGEVANLQDEADEYCAYTLPYKPVMNILQEKKLGWMAWSWDNDVCPERQITTAGSVSSLTTFGTDILTNGYYGLNTTSPAKSKYLTLGDCMTSADDINLANNQVKIYPNPASSSFLVDLYSGLAKPSIFVTDISGRNIMIQVEEIAPGKQYKVSVTGAAAGLYLVHIKSTHFATVQNILIQ
jgi:mannan endo-1,4-beta-mannosidase